MNMENKEKKKETTKLNLTILKFLLTKVSCIGLPLPPTQL
jgi:hypothetical protein